MQAQIPVVSRLNIALCSTARFYRDESGQDIVEYALLAALVGLGSVAGTQNLASAVANDFTNIGTALANAIPADSGSSGAGSGSSGGESGGGNQGGGNQGGGNQGGRGHGHGGGHGGGGGGGRGGHGRFF